MPYAVDYSEAAARYARLGSGPAAAKVVERLAWAAADLNWAGREMARLASECRWRAQICDVYRRAVWAWWAMPPLSRPGYPTQPYIWVSRL